MQSRSIAPRRAPSWPVELVTRRSTWSWAVRRPRRCRRRSARASSCRPRTSSSRWSSRRNLWGRRSSRTSRLKRLSACTACPPRRERDTRTGRDARTTLGRSHARTHARKRARARGIAIPPQSLRGVGPLRFVRGLRLFIAPSRRRRADAESCRARATWPPEERTHMQTGWTDGRTDDRSTEIAPSKGQGRVWSSLLDIHGPFHSIGGGWRFVEEGHGGARHCRGSRTVLPARYRPYQRYDSRGSIASIATTGMRDSRRTKAARFARTLNIGR